MKALNRKTAPNTKTYPEKIIQFGEGNFLRAFFDWFVYKMNEELSFNSGITVVQPIENGLCEVLDAQDGLYHLYQQGISDGKTINNATLIDSIQRVINPYKQFAEYSALAENPELRFVVSNTTEAGIAYLEDDTLDMQPQDSFPGKVTGLLYKRYLAFDGAADKGLIFFCCELIERNGEKLKEYVLKYAQAWKLPDAFIDWVNKANTFCNTLVDRIVPGYPKDNIDSIHSSLGYQDKLVVAAELFHVWVIEAPNWVEKEFPAHQAGLNVAFTDDLTPFRERKVRVLNGAHSSSCAISILSNIDTVQKTVEDAVLGQFKKDLIFEEICPNIGLPEKEAKAFADKILERFYNPYIKHLWESIALNSVSKWQTRVLPSLIDYHKKSNSLPHRIVFSLAALIVFYRGEYNGKPLPVNDGKEITDFFATSWSKFDDTDSSALQLSEDILGNSSIWKTNLNDDIPGLASLVAKYMLDIQNLGMPEALTQLPRS